VLLEASLRSLSPNAVCVYDGLLVCHQ
jgi:hypothetical protein